MRILVITAILFVSTFIVHGQNAMQEGFTFLENGDFSKAEVFFKAYLEKEPANKTANICYARAVGLNGAPEKANTLFGNLLKEYPKDFEVAINYNESFLWAKQYKKAKPLYEDLIAEYPDKFAAVLGYANTLSNLKEYPEALVWINKALALSPDNQSAKISKKYIRLGYANAYVNAQEYEKGVKLLHAIFTDFPGDKDALLNLANIHLITKDVTKAKNTYKSYATSPQDSITALNGIALAEHIDENEKDALEIATMARRRVAKFDNVELKKRTYERYVQALIWNRKFRTARKQIDSLETTKINGNWVLALRATLGMYTGSFKISLASYDAILANDSKSFDGNLGKANALFASDRIIPAYAATYKTLEVFKNQKDAVGLIEKMNIVHTPTIEEHFAYTFDNGNNVAVSNTLNAFFPFSSKFKTTLSYQFRTTENTISGSKADSHVLLGGIDYKLMPLVNLNTVFGINNSHFITDAYTLPIFDTKLLIKAFKLQFLSLGYQREVQNFNADLIGRKIVMNHYSLNYNLGTNVNLGWYTQIMRTEQSDDNSRNLLFTSLYYTVLQKPALKFGLNYQYISFSEQLPTIYFSPETYQAGELFADIRGKISENTTYMGSFATGLQKVEEDPKTPIFRAEAAIKHQFGKRLSGNIYGKYSNIASATAAGFQFTEIGAKIKWLFTKKPWILDLKTKQ